MTPAVLRQLKINLYIPRQVSGTDQHSLFSATGFFYLPVLSIAHRSARFFQQCAFRYLAFWFSADAGNQQNSICLGALVQLFSSSDKFFFIIILRVQQYISFFFWSIGLLQRFPNITNFLLISLLMTGYTCDESRICCTSCKFQFFFYQQCFCNQVFIMIQCRKIIAIFFIENRMVSLDNLK